MRPVRQHLQPSPARLWVLVLALLVAQTLGLAHRVLHGAASATLDGPPAQGMAGVAGFAAPVHLHAADEPCAEAHAADGAPADPWHAHEAGSAECRLVDQLAQVDLCGGVAAATAVVPPVVGWGRPGLRLDPPGVCPGDYLARAPPRA